MKWKIYILIALINLSCNIDNKDIKNENHFDKSVKTREKHPDFNTYWYDGFAEITSYKLEQSRYGETHVGTATLIYVTEPFLPEKQVKADFTNDKNISVLKLNSTKKFVTGIYPYSLMTSTFTPINKEDHAIKIAFSSQEWCGNTFVQLNNRKNFEIDFHSYFESNSDKELALKKEWLENDIWTVLRISPKNLPIGTIKIIPSFEYLALNHKEIKSYDATVTLEKNIDNFTYTLFYPELKRELKIVFSNQFPFQIHNWLETITQNNDKKLTKATVMQSIKTKYWNKNKPKDTILRQKLNY